jgi:lipoprotein-anchoring transpeptidase ErfK/SrfK
VWRCWGSALRISTSVVVGLAAIVSAFAGARDEAAAQFYPPPFPDDYYPAPPAAYPARPPQPYPSAPPRGPYGQAPYYYRDANGFPVRPYDADYDEQSGYPPGPYVSPPGRPYFVPGGEQYPRPPVSVGGPGPDRDTVIAALPPDYQPESGPVRELAPQWRRQLVDYPTSQPAGTVIIDTPHTYLYLVLGGGKAIRYGIGVGREGFTWSGTERISRMTEWPDWHPPKEMIERQPYLPRFMAGGEGNPLGARALYLGNTLYRIHGTNQPSTIGHFVSSGCIRLSNADIEDLYSRVNVGSRVVVLPGSPAAAAAREPVAR